MKKNNKLDSLTEWIDFYSNQLINEAKSEQQPEEYRVYEQGQIILVRLGINIGSEMSKNHFCIVLNKDDSSAASKLTVVPISSKEQPGYLNITTEYKVAFLEYTRLLTNELGEETDKLVAMTQKLTEKNAALQDSTNKLNQNPHIIDNITEANLKKEEVIFHVKIIEKQEAALVRKGEILSDIKDRLGRRINTYVSYKDITTISKQRILEKQGKKHYPHVALPSETIRLIKQNINEFLL